MKNYVIKESWHAPSPSLCLIYPLVLILDGNSEIGEICVDINLICFNDLLIDSSREFEFITSHVRDVFCVTI